ncbi:hypothetical protein D0T49_02420 [Paludibacter sp. 221]|nr:hypothetical protein [Paludibacter sp. 221]
MPGLSLVCNEGLNGNHVLNVKPLTSRCKREVGIIYFRHKLRFAKLAPIGEAGNKSDETGLTMEPYFRKPTLVTSMLYEVQPYYLIFQMI